jgi:cation:H+ antiporter
MFNILAAMGIPGLIYPSVLPDGVLDRDVPVLFVLTITLLLMAYGRTRQNYINRIEGAMLFACFVGYQGFIYTTELQ